MKTFRVYGVSRDDSERVFLGDVDAPDQFVAADVSILMLREYVLRHPGTQLEHVQLDGPGEDGRVD